MKTFVVLSDSHGRRAAIKKLAPIFAENDYIVHLGDGAGDMRETVGEYPEKTYVLKGNNDFSYGMNECVIKAEHVSIFCCHGHKYGVKRGLSELARRAKELGCEVALYGHTHISSIEQVDGVLCICPGAIGGYADASYCYMVIHGEKVTPVLVPVE
ncbi:MAG: metallophosphoesterase [Clostridiales bacterium]|nr:metallophosphoesterase [Clostridiales bacterium]